MANRKTILMERYELGRLLGQGNFGKVYHAKNLESGQIVALKTIDRWKVTKVGLVEQTKREILIMRLVRHPNIVQLFEVMANKSKIYFVMEYAKGGELFAKLGKGKLQEDVARKYFQQLISAVDYCHSRGVYHRDLKPENLLLDDNDNLKVSDFGLGALAESKGQDGLLHTICGTPAYCAPEVMRVAGYDGAKADIWSCGVVLFVLLAGYLPFHDSNLVQVYKKIIKGEVTYPSWFSSAAQRLIKRILDPNPCTRITIAKIKENKWFRKGFDDNKLKCEEEANVDVPSDVARVFSSSGSNTNDGNAVPFEARKLNAFDIISLSAGFDLSGLFQKRDQKKQERFASKKPASAIISKLEGVAKSLKLKIMKKDDGVFKIEGLKRGRKGVVGIEAEIFEVTPSFHFVEIKKSNGDTLEYQKLLEEDMRPALKDIVWAWQGEQVHLRQ